MCTILSPSGVDIFFTCIGCLNCKGDSIFFSLSVNKQQIAHKHFPTAGQYLAHARVKPGGYAMLMGSNKAETIVHNWPGDMAVRMSKALARLRGSVRVPFGVCLFVLLE